MSRDDIIRMAREAGLPAFLYPELIAETDWKLIERFAALIAEHTLANIDPSKFMSYQEGLEAGRLAEREACARVCEKNADDDTEGEWDSACISCANHIRERGQA
jgi:hypothetical protein